MNSWLENTKDLTVRKIIPLFLFVRKNLVPLITFIIFGSTFSIISYLRYLAFSQNVFDLGVNASLLFEVRNLDFIGTISSPYPIAMNKLIYIPIGVIYAIYPKEWILLFYQDFFLAFSGVLIYLIARFYKLPHYTSILIEFIFYIYYPISGVFWFDFHFMAFFPTLFLSTFYLYKTGSKKWIFLAFLTSITDFMAPVLIFLLVFVEVVKRIKNGERKIKLLNAEFCVLAMSVIIFALPFLYYRTNFVSHYVNNITPVTLYSNPWFKLEFIARTLIPFIFLPVLGIEYLFISFPYVVMVFFNNYLPYENLMFFQYPSLYAPLLFISLIIAMKRISSKKILKRQIKTIIIVLLLINIVLFSFYTPIGDLYTHKDDNMAISPWLTGSQTFYETYQKIVPTKTDSELMRMISLVPQGSSIFIQGNFPEFAQGYNYVCPGQNITGTPPEFIITDPYNYHFSQAIYYNGKLLTYYKEVNALLENHNYGTYAYYDGAYLFKLGYTGSPLISGNMSYNLTLSDFHYQNNSYNGKIYLINPGYIRLSGYINTGQKIPTSIYIGNREIINENVSMFHIKKTITSITYLVDLNITINTERVQSLYLNICEWGA